MSEEILGLDELRTLRQDNPERLFEHLGLVMRSFVFGVEDDRARPARAGDDDEDDAPGWDPDAADDEDDPPRVGWGGEVRIVINRNVVLHLVAGFNPDMRTAAELPQFCAMPDAERADHTAPTSIALDDGDVIRGVVFYVDPSEWDELVREARRVRERYEDWDAVPDTYYLDSPLVRFIEQVVLEHDAVQAERQYDWKRGLVGGVSPPEDLVADESAEQEPWVPDDADEDSPRRPSARDPDDPDADVDPDADPDSARDPDDPDRDPDDEEFTDDGRRADDDEDDDDDDDPDAGPSDDDDDDSEGPPDRFRTAWGRT